MPSLLVSINNIHPLCHVLFVANRVVREFLNTAVERQVSIAFSNLNIATLVYDWRICLLKVGIAIVSVMLRITKVIMSSYNVNPFDFIENPSVVFVFNA